MFDNVNCVLLRITSAGRRSVILRDKGDISSYIIKRGQKKLICLFIRFVEVIRSDADVSLFLWARISDTNVDGFFYSHQHHSGVVLSIGTHFKTLMLEHLRKVQSITGAKKMTIIYLKKLSPFIVIYDL